MADDTTTDVSEEPGTATDTGQQDNVDAGLGEGGKKALEAERKARAAAEKSATAAQKKLDDMARRLQAFEDRDKTEAQKLAEAKTAAERDAEQAKTELLRYRVAAKKKLPAELAARLCGSTEEEMASDADSLLEVLGSQKPATPSYDGGVRQTPVAPADMNSLIRHAAGRG